MEIFLLYLFTRLDAVSTLFRLGAAVALGALGLKECCHH